MIIALKTLNSCLSESIPASLIEAATRPVGKPSGALSASGNSKDVSENVNATRKHIAAAFATLQRARKSARFVAASFTPVARVANSVLRDVITTLGVSAEVSPPCSPIILARKPFRGTVAANVLEHGTGAMNVDACRLRCAGESPTAKRRKHGYSPNNEKAAESQAKGQLRDRTDPAKRAAPHPSDSLGRWPANVILQHSPECVCVGTRKVDGYKVNRFTDGAKPFGGGAGHEYESEDMPGGDVDIWACVPGCPVRMLDEQSGTAPRKPARAGRKGGCGFGNFDDATSAAEMGRWPGDAGGGASRFLYNAKASTAERSAGLPEGERNLHPTVKPIEVMRWLARLLCPPGGAILEPFAGSGTTACACELEGFDYRACEKDKGYVHMARLRAAHWRSVAEQAELDEYNREPLLAMLEAGKQ